MRDIKSQGNKLEQAGHEMKKESGLFTLGKRNQETSHMGGKYECSECLKSMTTVA